MASCFFIAALLCVCVKAAPPASPQFFQNPFAQSLNYYNLEGPEVNNHNHAQQRQGESSEGKAPARLETLEPDSEVELIPGAQPPQQPPQQPPVSPNLPGLLPGQRVFIVHMPVPGYRPGTIGGYQPVYIVAAAPQGNPGFPENEYQNAVLLNPSGQPIVSPALGYPRAGPGGLVQGVNPGLVFRHAPLTLNRPFNLVYQNPALSTAPVPQGTEAEFDGALQFSQLVALQGQHQPAAVNVRAINGAPVNSVPKQLSEVKEASAEQQRKVRPTHTQIRKP